MPHELPVSNLTSKEWCLLIAAVAAYQHNVEYQAIHMKLLAQQSLAQALVDSLTLSRTRDSLPGLVPGRRVTKERIARASEASRDALPPTTPG